jgi:hypothetical protein
METAVVKRRAAAQATYLDGRGDCVTAPRRDRTEADRQASRAAEHLARAGVVRCDPIEPLPPGFRGGWIMSPANIVHMVREPDAW